MTTAATATDLRRSLRQVCCDLDDALDLLEEVTDLPADAAAQVLGAADALATALAELANSIGP